ncbi:hypothetical protein [Hydrogenivirga sp. 128-5-R1-1]|uniref:hypothetical protein n=1 Tax=Hydrogenivirga sp. 128-5-R1-1 TaxID=392423 RepID=UPI00015EF68E|nr:hypothetical protein [Hydrogenivirga sp. 128-5-R1-1]EDP73060.1 hypothetical protein HG1285_11258 [Hydrogenivirga sp. 128-5-R1-1]
MEELKRFNKELEKIVKALERSPEEEIMKEILINLNWEIVKLIDKLGNGKEIKEKKSQQVSPLISVDIHLNGCQFFVVPQSIVPVLDKLFPSLTPSKISQEISLKSQEIKEDVHQVLNAVLEEFSRQYSVNNKKEKENKEPHCSSSSSPDNETLKNSTTREV